MKKLLISIGLGIATYACISFMPNTPVLIETQEALLKPGALLASALWSEGIHSDAGIAWLAVAVLANVVLFSLIWYGVVLAMKRRTR